MQFVTCYAPLWPIRRPAYDRCRTAYWLFACRSLHVLFCPEEMHVVSKQNTAGWWVPDAQEETSSKLEDAIFSSWTQATSVCSFSIASLLHRFCYQECGLSTPLLALSSLPPPLMLNAVLAPLSMYVSSSGVAVLPSLRNSLLPLC